MVRFSGENARVATVHVGISGYAYKEWQGEGLFYPPGLPQARYLEYYVSRYEALEAVGTWMAMPADSTVAKWLATTEGFRVSPKMHKLVTHLGRLKPKSFEPLNTFVEKLAPVEKAGKLGPVLLQLPPNLKRDDALLAAFLAEIPRRETLKWAIEFRNETWNAPEVEEMLREYGVAWVDAEDEESDAPRRDTASFIYARLRKDDYPEARLQEWAAYLRSKRDEGKDAYVFVKHQDAEAPWLWADRLAQLLVD